jgi:UDP-N-acetylglucosamine 2-epimerase (non-hydrolysing)
MIKVMLVYGTRPEAIKMAPVARELINRSDTFQCIQCVTAQHRQMLDQVMETFSLASDYDLDIMTAAQSPADVGASIFSKLPPVFDEVKPDFLLVQGDTMTTVSAAFAAYLQRIPVGHIEAGLRTGNLDHPFPEEMNRRLTSQLTTLHFPPTEGARDALLREGFAQANIHVTGNTVIDALHLTLSDDYEFIDPALQRMEPDKKIILVTTHRRENFGEPLLGICSAVAELADSRDDLAVVWPVHKNPSVSKIVHSRLSGRKNVKLIEPLEYREFVHLMAKSSIILSDSGGIQEEAPSLNIPVLVLRKATERPEGVTAGATQLVGTDAEEILEATTRLLDDEKVYAKMASATNPYGDGFAAQRIANAIKAYFHENQRQ